MCTPYSFRHNNTSKKILNRKEEIKVGYVTIDAIQYESLIRENERLKSENDKLDSMLRHSEILINRIERMYDELLNKIPR